VKETNRRTKIVCTIGPVTESPENLAALMDAGMDVARLNFSHGTHAEHAQKIKIIRKCAAEKDRNVAILQDLSGPKIRIGKMKKKVILAPGDMFNLWRDERPGDADGVSTSFPNIIQTVEPGDTVLLADGGLNLEVVSTCEDHVKCKVVVGGELSSHKGINLPNRSLSVSSLTPKDKSDLAFGIAQNVDWVALSFVRRPNDILKVKSIIRKAGANIPVIAKIEKHEAVSAIDEIISAADGIMVARGDLAVETALEQVPLVQKMIIEKCIEQGKPVITATQMLQSMTENPRPTRAEAADVANAVLDGSDAVMLSEETAVGAYPIVTVNMMSRILIEAEKGAAAIWELRDHERGFVGIPASVSRAAVMMAKDVDASCIITPTRTGATARMVARYRPNRPIFALCTSEYAQQRLGVVRGVYASLCEEARDSDEIIQIAIKQAIESGFAKKGDRVVITAALPPRHSGATNLIKVEEI